MSEKYVVPIWEKYSLTVEEAATYFRIGEQNCAGLRTKTRTLHTFYGTEIARSSKEKNSKNTLID